MVTNTILDIAGSVLEVALVGLLGLLFTWIRSRMQSERMGSALDALEKAAVITVGELQQTTVSELKAARKDGKLSKDDIVGLGEKALKLIASRMGESALETLRAAGMDIEDVIHAHVETAVLGLKKAQ